MKKLLSFTILAAMIVFAACENTIKYEYDKDDGEITVLGQLSTADTLHAIYLSMSYPDRTEPLPKAKVECFVNGERSIAEEIPVSTDETYISHYYTEYVFNAVFRPGDKVRIEASAGGQNAWTESVVPDPGVIIAVDTASVVKSMVEGGDTYDKEYMELKVRLSDVKGSENYFTLDPEMSVVETLSSGRGEVTDVFFNGPSHIDYDTFHDLILEDGYSSGLGDLFEDLMPVNSMHCFSDKAFRDSEATVRMYVTSDHFRAGSGSYYQYYTHYFEIAAKVEVERTLHISFKTFDRDFYNYLRALNNFRCYGYDVEPIIEPTMLPNNVNGGMGMVSVMAESRVDLKLPKETFIRGKSYPVYD